MEDGNQEEIGGEMYFQPRNLWLGHLPFIHRREVLKAKRSIWRVMYIIDRVMFLVTT